MALYTNLDGTTPDKGLRDVLKWQWSRMREKRKAAPPFTTPRVDNDGSGLRSVEDQLTWIGHATFAMRLGGKLIVTDPIWSERIQGAVKRESAPGVAFGAMPTIDIATISHSHFDHLDLATCKRIGRKTKFVVPMGCAELLYDEGLNDVVELGWWESTKIDNLTITLVPAQHWSMRMPWDKNTRLWGGFVYQTPELTAYHAGDTAYAKTVFEQIGARFPAIDYAMLPIGAYDPPWFMQPQHMGPEEALQAFIDLGAKQFVAMHWGTFRLTDEPLGEPPERLRAAWEAKVGTATQPIVQAVGERVLLTR
jgi:N-acyl-phosphatidylethanolamine-hydrolysing phospholipase D